MQLCKEHIPVEETPSLLLGVEQRIHHVCSYHLQLAFYKNNSLAACWQCLTQQAKMGP